MFTTGRTVQISTPRQYVQTLTASAQLYELLRWFERFASKPYVCAAGKLTIGYGHVILPNEAWLREGAIGVDTAAGLLGNDVARFERDVRALVSTPVTQGEFDALVSFAFNVGSDIDADTKAEGLGDSTLLRLLNAGNYEGAAREFGLWVNARDPITGVLVKLNGLVRRRAAERALFEGREWRVFTRDDWKCHL